MLCVILQDLLGMHQTSIELLDLYQKKGGNDTNRSRFINSLCDHMRNKIYVFASPGIASIIMLTDKAASTFKLESENDDEDDVPIQQIAKMIKQDIKRLNHRNKEYCTICSMNVAVPF